MEFRTTVLLGGTTATGLVVPGDVAAALDDAQRTVSAAVRTALGG